MLKQIKLAILVILPFVLLILLMNACASPTKLDSSFYYMRTNSVITPEVVLVKRTNALSVVTSRVSEVFTNGVTNTFTSYLTSSIPIVEEVPVTNWNVDAWVDYTPNENVTTTAAAAGGIASLFGLGGIVSTAITGIFALVAHIRSSRSHRAVIGLVEGVEVVRQILKQVPGLDQCYSSTASWLENSQRSDGVQPYINTVLQREIDPLLLSSIASEIIKQSKTNETSSR